jgi:hypothetical protein
MEDYDALTRLVSVHPDSHRAVDLQRHHDLLRRARSGELSSAIAESRRADRRSRLALLRERRRLAAVPSAALTEA